MSKETKKKGTKKPYQKPEIVFEDFSLSTSIAASCDVITNTPSAKQCGIQMEDVGMVFTNEVESCGYKSADGSFGYCYHAPNDDSNLFNS